MRMAGAAEGGRGKGAPGARRRPWATSPAGWARKKGRKGGGGKEPCRFRSPPPPHSKNFAPARAARALGEGGKGEAGGAPAGGAFCGSKKRQLSPPQGTP